MPREHVVEQGEHLASVAAQHGFRDLATVWEHPDNAPLKEQRGDFNVLAPGDVIALPEPEPKEVSIATRATHRFVVVRRSTLSLRVRLLDLAGKPVASTACTVSVDGAELEATTDADGVLEQPIIPETRVVTVTLGALSYELRVGWLDPPDTLAGIAARLSALGYPAGDPDEPDEEQLAFAADLFCFDQGLPVRGELDATLSGALSGAFGC